MERVWALERQTSLILAPQPWLTPLVLGHPPQKDDAGAVGQPMGELHKHQFHPATWYSGPGVQEEAVGTRPDRGRKEVSRCQGRKTLSCLLCGTAFVLLTLHR